MELTEVVLNGGRKFIIYTSPMKDNRLRCQLGGDAGNKPEAIIKQLVMQRCNARPEGRTNACGECTNQPCLWDSCFSVPFTELEEVICNLCYAAARLYGKCEHIKIVISHLGKSYELIWWQNRRLRYINFDGIDNSLLKQFDSSPKFSQVKSLDYENKRVAIIMTLQRKTNLMDALEEVVLTAGQNGN